MWTVRYLPEAEEERQALPAQEHPSLINAERKLAALGPKLRAPHTSAVRRVRGTLRELRPRAGQSPYRALYRQVGQDFVIAAIARTASLTVGASIGPRRWPWSVWRPRKDYNNVRIGCSRMKTARDSQRL